MINERNIEKVKKYISQYFIKLTSTQQVFMWILEENKFDLLDDNLVKSRYFTKDY